MTYEDKRSSDLDFHIQMYANAGYAIFPVVYHNEKKVPKHSGWRKKLPNREINPRSIQTTAFGITLQHDDFIVDYDGRRDPTRTQLKEYFAFLKIPNPVPTFIVKTGGNEPSYHLYFKKPEDFIVQKGEVPGYPAIEIKSEGNFVVGAGSLHFSGNHYSIFRGSLDEIMQAPEELLNDRLKHNIVEASGRNGSLDSGMGSGDVSTYIRFLSDTEAPDEGNRNEATYKVACVGFDYGLVESEVLECMLEHYWEKCNPPLPLPEFHTIISSASSTRKGAISRTSPEIPETIINEVQGSGNNNDVSRQSIFNQDIPYWDTVRRNGIDVFAGTIRNLVQVFGVPISNTYALMNLIKYNEFSRRIEFTKLAPWHDAYQDEWRNIDTLCLKTWLNENTSIQADTSVIYEAVEVSAERKSYHPVRDYLNSLKWDKVSRLDTFLPIYTGAADTQYTREVGKCTLIALVARIFNPGVQHDHVLILEGQQGSGKTSFCRILGGPWYLNIRLDIANKDTVLNMQGGWIIEMAEMQPTRKQDIEELKDFLTRLVDKERPPFKRIVETFKRQCGFIGTVNQGPDNGYLRDVTGNRRFWPVATHKIDLHSLARDRDQLFAEAVELYRSGVPHYLTNDDTLAMARIEQESRVITDSWGEIIDEWLTRVGHEIQEPLTTNYIAMNVLNIHPSRFSYYEKIRLTRNLESIGMKYKQKRVDGKTMRIWTKGDYDV